MVEVAPRPRRNGSRRNARPVTLTREEVRDILPSLPTRSATQFSGHANHALRSQPYPSNWRGNDDGQISPFAYHQGVDQYPSQSPIYSNTLTPTQNQPLAGSESQSYFPSHQTRGTASSVGRGGGAGTDRERDSMWADDSEYDVMAEAGSSIARTLSTTSISTRARLSEFGGGDESNRPAAVNVFDHPAYTYRRPLVHASMGSGSAGFGTLTGSSGGPGTGTWNATTLSPVSPTTPSSATPLAPWAASMAFMIGSDSRSASPAPTYRDDPASHSTSVSRAFVNQSSYGHDSRYLSTALPSITPLASPVHFQPQQHSIQPRLEYQHPDVNNHRELAETQSLHSEDGNFERPSIDPQTGLRRAITIIRHSDATALRPGAFSTRIEREGGRGAGLVELPPLYEEAVGVSR